MAKTMIDIFNPQTDIKITGIRPGEKIHEILVSEEECNRTYRVSDDYYAIFPVNFESTREADSVNLDKEYSSKDNMMDEEELKQLITNNKFEGAE